MANLNNEEILKLYKSGLTSIEISKALDLPLEDVMDATHDYVEAVSNVQCINKIPNAPVVPCMGCGGDTRVIAYRREEGSKHYNIAVILLTILFFIPLTILYLIFGGEKEVIDVYTYECPDCGLKFEKRVK